MSGGDIEKIFTLLRQFYSGCAVWKDTTKLYAYRLALEPYSYEQIKGRVLEHARTNSSFPFVSELTGGLAPPAPPKTEETEDGEYVSLEEYERVKRLLEALRAR